ncbi:hypothetical protein APR11_000036 [Nocardia amikacinitolerans]|uniref:hypothetical protein n=1 Tax=Nocardia amikacinitolerans TaxID=756689 RepID=UPI0020A47B01|nr:hypothetical protein [Nocardia amikacinitolerans]MCP2293632.1 hypothetical protein [Nocardia amikacinitolerans]
MRIARNFDNDPDDDHNEKDQVEQAVELLIDEAEDFLAEQAAANPYHPDATSAAVAGPQPQRPAPRLRLVKNPDPAVPVEDKHLPPALRPTVTVTAPPRRRVPRWVRTTLPGSLVVVLGAAALANGQPGVVAAPLAAYAAGWVAFLAWNAAYRPPLAQVAASTISLLARTIAAVIGGTVRTARAVVGRIDTARQRSETTRTAH